MDRLRGLAFAKQYPSSLEPARGSFVADQVRITSDDVDWRVIAPVPWAPRWIGSLVRRPQPPRRECLAGVDVTHPRYLVGPARTGYAGAGRAMARAASADYAAALREGIDFVHAHALYPSGSAAAALAADVPLVLTVHGSDLYAHVGDARLRALAREAALAARRLIAVSPPLASDLARLLDLDPKRIEVVPDAYDDRTFRPVRRQRHEGRVRLLYVGRLEPVKGPDVLLDAVRQLVAAGHDIAVTFVGAGSLLRELGARTEEAGLGGRVTFAGTLPPAGVAESMAASDIFVQPSRREGFGVAVVEAMATGLPVVATRSGGPEETVVPEAGELVAAGDADALAAGIAGAIGRLGSFDPETIHARAAARYSGAAVASRLVSVYRGVVGGARS